MKIFPLFYLFALSNACFTREKPHDLYYEKEKISYNGNIEGTKNLYELSSIKLEKLCEVPRQCLEDKRSALSADCKKIQNCENEILEGKEFKEFLKSTQYQSKYEAIINEQKIIYFFVCLDEKYSC